MLSFSDQQLITELVVGIAVKSLVRCSISQYHYNLTCDLLIISIITHSMSTIAVKNRLYPNWIVGVQRYAAILAHFGIAAQIFANRNTVAFSVDTLLKGHTTGLVLPAACTLGSAKFAEDLEMLKGGELKDEDYWRIQGLTMSRAVYEFFIPGMATPVVQMLVTHRPRKSNVDTAAWWYYISWFLRCAILVCAWIFTIVTYGYAHTMRT